MPELLQQLIEGTEADTGTMVGDTTESFLPNNFPVARRPGQPRSGTPPASLKHTSGGDPLSRYEDEKRQGLRRSNGARKLKKLSNRHLEIIARHLQGESGEQISSVMGITGITVSRVLNDPMAKDFLARIYEDRQGEIDALAGAAIDVVRDGLRGNHTLREKLTAVDKYTKLKDSIGKEEDGALTAEDVIQRMMESFTITDSQVQINVGGK